MLGNVLEWCQDWYGPYQTGIRDNPMGLGKGEAKIVRGGWWGGSPRFVRVSYRNGVGPTVQSGLIGFRCAGE